MPTARRFLEVSRSVHCLWREPQAIEGYSSAISLHSHTMHSREGLDFIPRVMNRVPLARAVLDRIERGHIQRTGTPVPYERASWRPPLNPHAAYELEAAQIAQLERHPLVSITDHDSLEACAELNSIGVAVPYSLEWTVPYHGTVFHIGVHNIPPDRAREFESALARVTAQPDSPRIAEALAALHSIPEVLLILNHPFSCEELMDRASHVSLLMRFLGEFGEWMHALELNGLQPADNNLATVRLATERNYPVISGGDRHCCEPNANLNLTNAATFADFVQEIRVDRRSTVLFMPQYRDPIPARYIEFIWHAVKPYPNFAGRERWTDRVHYQRETGEVLTFAELFPDGCHPVISSFVSVIAFLASPGMRAMLCLALGRTVQLEPEAL